MHNVCLRAAAFRGTTLHRWFACLHFLPSVLRCGLKPWLGVPLVWPVITVQCCSSPFSLHLHLPCCICSPLKVVTSAHSYLHYLITLESHGQSDRSTFMGLAFLNCHLGSILFYFPLRWFLFDSKLLVICILKGDINQTYSPCIPKSHSLRHKLLWQCLDEWRNAENAASCFLFQCCSWSELINSEYFHPELSARVSREGKQSSVEPQYCRSPW